MRSLRRFVPWFFPVLALLVVAVLFGGDPRAFAEGDKPDAPPAGAGAGMDDPTPAPAMGDTPAEAPEEDDEEELPQALSDRVQRSIDNGVKWLKQAQLADGSWGAVQGNALYGGGALKDPPKDHPAGPTALALYTLLKCKVPLDDATVKKGFGFLRSKHRVPKGTYELSAMLLAVTATADPFKKMKASEAQGDRVKFPGGDWRDWAQKLHDTLLSKRTKAKTLGWRYNVEGTTGSPKEGPEDLHSTLWAALGLLAAERCSIKTDSKVWNELITFSMRQQADDGPEWDRAVYDRPAKNVDLSKLSDKDKERYGPPQGGGPTPGKAAKDRARGFAYIKSTTLPPDEGQPTGGMTAAGVAIQMIARYVLMKRNDPMWDGRDKNAVQQSIYDGCAWLDMNWSAFENPQKQKFNVYHINYMYSVERAFDLIGNRLLGKRPWYEIMADQLVGRQKDKGFWNSNSTHKPEEVLDTCFALLFLKRSTKGGIPYGSITGGGDEPPVDNRGR